MSSPGARKPNLNWDDPVTAFDLTIGLLGGSTVEVCGGRHGLASALTGLGPQPTWMPWSARNSRTMAHLAVGGEGVPLFTKVLTVDGVAEPEEGTLALDRPLQPLPDGLIVLPPGEGRHVPSAVPGTGAVEPKAAVRLLLHVDGGVLSDHHGVSGAVVVHLTGAQVAVATGRQARIPFQHDDINRDFIQRRCDGVVL